MPQPKIPNQRKANLEHKKRVEKYAVLIQQVYDKFAKEATFAVSLSDPDTDKPFSFSDYPMTKEVIKRLQSQLMSDIRGIIMSGTSAEWKESNLVQDLVAKKVLTAYTGTNRFGEEYTRYFQTNPEALTAFQNRKDEGMNLSTRVWSLSEQYKSELEDSITAAIAPGTSAMELAAQVKQYLKYPDKRFRRIKEKLDDGTIKWHLSKNAKSFHPGQGVYRSSARNAQRLARTEINMAYRTAEQERWKQFDFVVGYEVKTTQNGHHMEDICDQLAGKYPKDFVFKGWHPQCLCYTIPILKTEDEFWSLDEDKPSVNEVKDVPDNFREWIADNSERIEKATERGTLPYFIKDNRKVVNAVLRGESTGKAVSNAENDSNPTEKTVSDTQKTVSQEEIRNQLNALLEVENPYANPKLVRIMTRKEFGEKYSVGSVNERTVMVQTPAGEVEVDLRHGPTELYENLEIASDRIRRHGYQIKLCEKREDGKGADSYNRTLERFEEYKVNTQGSKGSIDRNIRDGAKQSDVIVLRLDGEITLDDLSRGMHDRAIRCQGLKEIIVLRNGKEAIYTRNQFRKNGFKIQPDDFK